MSQKSFVSLWTNTTTPKPAQKVFNFRDRDKIEFKVLKLTKIEPHPNFLSVNQRQHLK